MRAGVVLVAVLVAVGEESPQQFLLVMCARWQPLAGFCLAGVDRVLVVCFVSG
jgi:hypothetical protein